MVQLPRESTGAFKWKCASPFEKRCLDGLCECLWQHRHHCRWQKGHRNVISGGYEAVAQHSAGKELGILFLNASPTYNNLNLSVKVLSRFGCLNVKRGFWRFQLIRIIIIISAPSVVTEHQHGIRKSDRRIGVHLHRSTSSFRHCQHPRLVP